MLKSMSSRLLTEWMAYYKLEPFGAELVDIHFARLNATLIDVNKSKGSAPSKTEKFRLWKNTKVFDPQEFYNKLKASLTMKKE